MKIFLIEVMNATESRTVEIKAWNWVAALEDAAVEYLWASGFRVLEMDGKPFSNVIHTR